MSCGELSNGLQIIAWRIEFWHKPVSWLKALPHVRGHLFFDSWVAEIEPMDRWQRKPMRLHLPVDSLYTIHASGVGQDNLTLRNRSPNSKRIEQWDSLISHSWALGALSGKRSRHETLISSSTTSLMTGYFASHSAASRNSFILSLTTTFVTNSYPWQSGLYTFLFIFIKDRGKPLLKA